MSKQQQPNRPKRTPYILHGWLNFCKPIGMTSADAVNYLKRTLNVKKIGHGGTLDPLAEGVLPIAIGDATKTMQFTLDADKTYRFTITFGTQTNTDDAEGTAVKTSDARPTQAELEAVLPQFTGPIQQTPPAFSAIKIDGQRAYKAARADNEVVIPPRPVTIHTLAIEDFTGDTATLTARVSKGTYVRSLARDIGQALKCYGYITFLQRTQAGIFPLGESVSKESLDKQAKEGHLPQQAVAELLQPLQVVLADIPDYIATPWEVALISLGKTPERWHIPAGKRKVVDRQGNIVSLVDFDDNGHMKIIRNFVPQKSGLVIS